MFTICINKWEHPLPLHLLLLLLHHLYKTAQCVVTKALYVEAIKLYRLAAAKGYAKAQFNLGLSYVCGNGISVDKVEGLRWMKLAAENGSQEAIAFLKSHHQ